MKTQLTCRLLAFLSFMTAPAFATPANRIAFSRHYERFLAKQLDNCATCHLTAKAGPSPTSLAEFPHNAFGDRLRTLGKELRTNGKRVDMPTRLQIVARADSDGDRVDNETELLLGHNPGAAHDKPTAQELAGAPIKRAEFARFLTEYRWLPFEPVTRPALPSYGSVGPMRNSEFGIQNPIDAFLMHERMARGLRPRPAAPRHVLLRRVYLDLIGLAPTPAELDAFERDLSPLAYERVVDRLLDDPRYGERWGRHWMDIWRYSDWAGYGAQVRDSKPHLWRWRDWIVDSLNRDKGYDRMVVAMLAGDELAPLDPDAVPGTGYLARNWKLLSREAWMEELIMHTSRAFLGITLECAKCHDHFYDPILQREYYQFRALFEPHQIRTDRLAGQPDLDRDGLPRAFDAAPDAPTFFYPRGDERAAVKDAPLSPGVPAFLGGSFEVKPVPLPRVAYEPERQDFIIREDLAEAERSVELARAALANDGRQPDLRELAQLKLSAAEARLSSLQAVVNAESLDPNQPDFNARAQAAVAAQRRQAVADARLALHQANKALTAMKVPTEAAKKKVADGEKALVEAERELTAPTSTKFKPRGTAYPQTSSGRRLALARWIASEQNPLAARVAVNHMWLRHFGAALVPSVTDFGRNGRAPTHPQLLDWLASEFMANGWSMKNVHRLMVTSAAYRMDSRPEATNAQLDPDNVYLWRMNSRQLEAEAVRDNVLHLAGALDFTLGGPDIDHALGLSVRRRSLYLRTAPEKQSEFLQVFDGPSPNECYERRPTVVPQQALALSNSELTLREAKSLARQLGATAEPKFIADAFVRVLARPPTAAETKACAAFLAQQASKLTAARARANLVLVLMNHSDFVTVR